MNGPIGGLAVLVDRDHVTVFTKVVFSPIPSIGLTFDTHLHASGGRSDAGLGAALTGRLETLANEGPLPLGLLLAQGDLANLPRRAILGNELHHSFLGIARWDRIPVRLEGNLHKAGDHIRVRFQIIRHPNALAFLSNNRRCEPDKQAENSNQ